MSAHGQERDGNEPGAVVRAAIANLFAVHLVRSPAHRAMGHRVGESVRQDLRDEAPNDPEVFAAFERDLGRPPTPEEIRAVVDAGYDGVRSKWDITTMVDHHNKVAELLNGKHIQIIELDRSRNRSLPGFVLGDVPVIHADEATGRFGFADHLAIGDADRILAPLKPTVLALFTETPLPAATVSKKRSVNALNAGLIRGALKEVVCRHEDAAAVQRVCRRLDRYLDDFWAL